MHLFHRTPTVIITLIMLLDTSQAWENNIFVPTRLECNVNPEWVANCTCKIKPISRNKKIVSLRADLVKPIQNLILHAQLYKRYNGWQPYLFNFTVDVCKFLNGGKTHYLMELLKPLIYEKSNINHPCPYNATVQIYDFDLNELYLPAIRSTIFPSGYYKLVLVLHESRNELITTIIAQAIVKESKN